jgi:hypothetical protein
MIPKAQKNITTIIIPLSSGNHNVDRPTSWLLYNPLDSFVIKSIYLFIFTHVTEPNILFSPYMKLSIKYFHLSRFIKLELCPKDTDAPTDNLYMVYSEKINKGP